MQHPLKSPDSSPKPSNFHMRVADIFSLSEDDEGCDGDDSIGIVEMTGFLRQPAEASCGLACGSPRRMVSRLMRRLKDRGLTAQWKERAQREKKEMVVDQSRNLRLVETRFDRGEESALTCPSGGDTGIGCCCCCFRKEAMSNSGGACSLVYLIGASKDELNKIKELRLEMQQLLHNAKEEEAWRKDSFGFEKAVDSKESSGGSCLTNNLKEEPSCCISATTTTSSRFDTFPPYLITREENNNNNTIIIMSGQPKKESSSEGGMELLEAELEAELELLQFQLDAESSSSSQSIKFDADDSALATSEKVGLNPRGEAIQPEILHGGGVPSIELERRLHELLESQQQEKIKELESAVEYLKKKLTKKERELSWWKDTALLVGANVKKT